MCYCIYFFFQYNKIPERQQTTSESDQSFPTSLCSLDCPGVFAVLQHTFLNFMNRFQFSFLPNSKPILAQYCSNSLFTFFCVYNYFYTYSSSCSHLILREAYLHHCALFCTLGIGSLLSVMKAQARGR